MKRLLFALVVISSLARAEVVPKSIDLLEGHSLTAWELVTLPTAPVELSVVCKFNADGSLAVAGKPVCFLASKVSFANFKFHAEWCWPKTAPKNSNGGILLHISSGPTNGTAWPQCFQIQNKLTRVGDLLPMHGAKFSEKLTTPPSVATAILERSAPDSEKPLGEWNACDVICRGDSIEVTINGVLQNKVMQCAPAAGKIGFQLEGAPFELRNLRIEPLE